MGKGVVLGCRRSRPTATLLARLAGWDYADGYNSCFQNLGGGDLVLRYGNSSELNTDNFSPGHSLPLDDYLEEREISVLNKAKCIARASNKLSARRAMRERGVSCPYTFETLSDDVLDRLQYPVVLRPFYHMKGRQFNVISNISELRANWDGSLYGSELILKKDEYRVFIVSGKVLEISQKVASKPTADKVIRNHGHGWVFKWIPFSDMKSANYCVIEESIKAVKSLGLYFGAVDICIGIDDRPYVFEVNTAPGMLERKAAKLIERIKANYGWSQ